MIGIPDHFDNYNLLVCLIWRVQGIGVEPSPIVRSTPARRLIALLPGLALCLAVGAVALALESVETWLLGRVWL